MSETEASEKGETRDDPYRIRRYRPDDRDGILALDSVVWNRTQSPEWFDWKYADNPYVDHVPVFVAELDGEIVGARPFMAFRMRLGDETATALQPSDTMVSPDHRRRGLFTRMTERAIEFYEEREPPFFFNFPNEQSRSGYLKLGWQEVGSRATYYRVQSPDAFLGNHLDGKLESLVGNAATSAVNGYYAARRLTAPSGTATVDRESGVPAARLAALYERRVPERIHAHRTAEFYQWRFASPAWERTTYTASNGGERVASIVVRTRTTEDGVTVTQLADVVPLVGGDEWEDAVSNLLGAILDDRGDADLISVGAGGLPDDLLRTYGFHPDTSPPLSLTADTRMTVARAVPNREPNWTWDGRHLTDERNWLLSLCEYDTV